MFPQGIYRVYLEKLDHDSRKEGGQKEGSQNEAGHIAGIERGDTNNERQGACEKQDKDLPEATKENNSDTSTGNEWKICLCHEALKKRSSSTSLCFTMLTL